MIKTIKYEKRCSAIPVILIWYNKNVDTLDSRLLGERFTDTALPAPGDNNTASSATAAFDQKLAARYT